MRQEDDYTLTPAGPLGGMVGLAQGGKYLGTFDDMEDALAEVRVHSAREQYWPNIWWVSDHGNEWQIDLDGREVPAESCPSCGLESTGDVADCPECGCRAGGA